jgi:hypothetical protein
VKQERSRQAPLARNKGLVIRELPDEVLVYDLERDKAHCLNQTAAFIWEHCDGHTTVSEISGLLENSLKVPIHEDVVWCALNQLKKDHLLVDSMVWPASTMQISRRTLVRRVALAAVLLPAVTTILAPTASAAGSCSGTCVFPGGSCSVGCVCCPDNLCKVVC